MDTIKSGYSGLIFYMSIDYVENKISDGAMLFF